MLACQCSTLELCFVNIAEWNVGIKGIDLMLSQCMSNFRDYVIYMIVWVRILMLKEKKMILFKDF